PRVVDHLGRPGGAGGQRVGQRPPGQVRGEKARVERVARAGRVDDGHVQGPGTGRFRTRAGRGAVFVQLDDDYGEQPPEPGQGGLQVQLVTGFGGGRGVTGAAAFVPGVTGPAAFV